MAIKTYDKSTQGMLYLSANFKVKEFACPCARCSKVKVDDKLVNYLQQIRDHFDKPLMINSGYRCKEHNAEVAHSSKKSKHTEGMAADIRITGVAPAEIAKYAESIGILGIGLYETSKDGYFVHVDTRTSKYFWYGQSTAKRTTFGGATADNLVKEFQEAAIKDGYTFPKYGCDGKWGSECEAVAKKAILYKTKWPWRLKNLTKFLQTQLGLEPDGKFGSGTANAVVEYQKTNGLSVDSKVGPATWKKICGVK